MSKNTGFSFFAVFLASCSPSQSNAPADDVSQGSASAINAMTRLDQKQAKSCMSDAECDPDQNCECPLSSENGNCESPGICVPRDKQKAMSAADQASAATPPSEAAVSLASCRPMRNLSFIPAGYHPTSARWELDAQGQINDLVCIVPTNSPQIRVLRWLDYPLPAGYYTLRVESGVDTTFRGCRQWTEWQGRRTCVASWDLYVMQKNS